MRKPNLLSLFIVTLLSAVALNSYAKHAKKPNPYSATLDKELFTKARTNLKDEKYRSASERYEKLLSYHPFSKYARNAQLEIIYAYYRNHEYVYAYSSANNFADIHPNDKNLDYVYYMKGLINFNRNIGTLEGYFNLDLSKHELESFKLSFHDFSTFVNQYPHSIYAQSARQHMIYIKNLLANHELYIAKFYLKQKAYIAVLNRLNNLIANFPNTKSAYSALNMLPNLYKKINLDGPADISNIILKYNH